jgi:hypothetical protein
VPAQRPGEGLDQAHGLSELGLEGERPTADAHAAQRQGRPAQVKGERQRQATPAPVNDLRQSDRDEGLRPRRTALSGLGGMVEAALAGEHLGAGLWIDRVVQRHQQAPVGERGGDRPPNTARTRAHGRFTEAMKVSYLASPSTTPQSVAMVRSRLEVREAVIGSRIACSVRMNRRARSWK